MMIYHGDPVDLVAVHKVRVNVKFDTFIYIDFVMSEKAKLFI